jgi:hypothetical protein
LRQSGQPQDDKREPYSAKALPGAFDALIDQAMGVAMAVGVPVVVVAVLGMGMGPTVGVGVDRVAVAVAISAQQLI